MSPYHSSMIQQTKKFYKLFFLALVSRRYLYFLLIMLQFDGWMIEIHLKPKKDKKNKGALQIEKNSIIIIADCLFIPFRLIISIFRVHNHQENGYKYYAYIIRNCRD